MEGLRIRKDSEEIQKIRESSEIADKVVENIRERKEEFIGETEEKLAEFIESEMKELGGEEPSFDTIVASGPNSSRPHHRSSDRTIEKREPVVLDFGCYKDNYPSDQTRTIALDGKPLEKFREIHRIVREAQQKAVEKVKPGVKAGEVDRAAREIIEKAGYGENFIHRTGHGVGLEVHEKPEIREGNSRKLEEGMVFSVEPGIYIEGEFGVRIEDLVLVTEDGYEKLNKTKRDWR